MISLGASTWPLLILRVRFKLGRPLFGAVAEQRKTIETAITSAISQT